MSTPDPLLAFEIVADAARAASSSREARRHRGVSWSGMAPEPFTPRTAEQLQACAQDRLTAHRAWREGPEGAFVTAVANCQAAAKEAFALAERARAGAARGEPSEWRRRLAEDLAIQARTILAAASQAGLAVSRD